MRVLIIIFTIAEHTEMRNNEDIKNFKEYEFLAFVIRTLMVNFEIQKKL
jgi:hypothetical protein